MVHVRGWTHPQRPSENHWKPKPPFQVSTHTASALRFRHVSQHVSQHVLTPCSMQLLFSKCCQKKHQPREGSGRSAASLSTASLRNACALGLLWAALGFVLDVTTLLRDVTSSSYLVLLHVHSFSFMFHMHCKCCPFPWTNLSCPCCWWLLLNNVSWWLLVADGCWSFLVLAVADLRVIVHPRPAWSAPNSLQLLVTWM